jgi:catechol 2,3-dioxygenase-like lactoylglutathione lyase family enzyme
MPITGLDHVNIRTSDPARTIGFYRDVLGMKYHDIMGFDDEARGGWMLDTAGRAAIHIGHSDLPYPSDPTSPWHPATGSGSVHHVSLACDDRAAMTARLTEHGYAMVENRVPQVSLVQLFVTDPTGILIELNFYEP